MIEVRVAIDIERPAADVFAFVSDMANNTRWQNGMRSCRWTSDPPIGVGSTYDQVASFLGREIITGPMSWFAPVMRPMVARSVNGDYERLKTLLESPNS